MAAGDPFTRLLAPSQGQSFQADTTGQLVHIGMQAQKAETEAGPFVRVSFVLTGRATVFWCVPAFMTVATLRLLS